MRTVMLPQMVSFISQDLYDNSFWVRTLINFFTYLPQLMMGLVAGGLLAYLVFDFYLMKLSYLARCRLLVKLPLLRRWIRTVVTHRLCRELGHFFQGGYAIGEIIQILHDYPIDPFLSEVAAQLQTQLLEGVPLGNALENLEVFTTSLPLIIRQGELTSQTGPKCQHYAKKLHQDLVDDISQKLAWVQPILFLIIGALVMAMYLVMLLPALTMDF